MIVATAFVSSEPMRFHRRDDAAAINRLSPPSDARLRAAPGHGRLLAWGPPAIAILIVVQLCWGGANDGVSSATAAFVDALVALGILLASPGTSRFWSRARLPLALFAAALLWSAIPGLVPAWLARGLGMPIRPAPDLFGLGLAKAMATTLLLIAAALLGYHGRSTRRLVMWLTALAMPYVLYAAVDALDWLHDAARGTRYSATIGNPNTAGIVFATIALLAGGVAIAPTDERPAVRLSALTGAIGALILGAMTGSRSAMLLVIIWSLLLIARRWARQRDPTSRWIVGLAAVATLTVTVAAALLTPVAGRSGRLAEDAGSRGAIIAHYAEVAANSPVWGFGLGSFFEVNQHTLTGSTAPLYWNFGAAHDAPLHLAVEAGWPCVLLLGGGLLVMLLHIAAAPRDWWSVVALCGVGAISCIALVDIALSVPAVAALYVVLVGSSWGAALAQRSGSLRLRAQRKAHAHRRAPHDRREPIPEPTV